MTHLHVRAEFKPLEKRVAISPANAKKLIDAGYSLSVERFPERAFRDEEYEAVGCKMVDNGSWPTAEPNAFIVGLKELPEETTPLTHRHIYFAHCYKGQTDWEKIMDRFNVGKGLLLDLEFLVNDQGRRVAAFGRAAGLAGCAVGLMVWCQQQLGKGQSLPALSPFETVNHLAEYVAKTLAAAKEATNGKTPKVIVMGAKGRCGNGAVQFLKMVGIEDASQWDMEETAKGGPFPEILEHDVFVNCIYLMGAIPPFLTKELITKERRLSVIVDVSCDYTNPHNPLPIYNQSTSFLAPTIPIHTGDGHKELELVSIDHLPSLIPRESSEDFSNDLMPSLLHLDNWANGRSGEMVGVWERARKLFQDKLVELEEWKKQH